MYSFVLRLVDCDFSWRQNQNLYSIWIFDYTNVVVMNRVWCKNCFLSVFKTYIWHAFEIFYSATYGWKWFQSFVQILCIVEHTIYNPEKIGRLFIRNSEIIHMLLSKRRFYIFKIYQVFIVYLKRTIEVYSGMKCPLLRFCIFVFLQDNGFKQLDGCYGGTWELSEISCWV